MLPVNSPPTEKPCSIRSSTSDTPAAMPICAWVGSRPIARLATPMITMLRLSIRRRPSRSPTGPSTRLPTGRIR